MQDGFHRVLIIEATSKIQGSFLDVFGDYAFGRIFFSWIRYRFPAFQDPGVAVSDQVGAESWQKTAATPMAN